MSVPKSIWKNWEKAGKEEFVKLCLALEPYSRNQAADGLASLMFCLVNRIAKKAVDLKSAATVVRKIIGKKPDLLYRFLDVVNALDGLHPPNSDGSRDEVRAALIGLLQEVLPAFAGCETVVRMRLDIGLLNEIGLLKNPHSFQTRLIKVKTKLYYKQQKYNMLREETEGFSKLLVHLTQDLSETNSETLSDITRSLIGHFNLDPNRVMQIIMSVLEARSGDARAVRILLGLLDGYADAEKNAIVEMAGWALKAKAEDLADGGGMADEEADLPFGNDDAGDLSDDGESGKADAKEDKGADAVRPAEKDQKTEAKREASISNITVKHPLSSLTVEEEFQRYRMVALLLQRGVIHVDDLRPWLSPSPSVMKEERENRLKQAREVLRKVHVVNTTGAAAEVPPDNWDTDDLMDPYFERCASNQWLSVIECLLSLGEWRCTKELLECGDIPEYFAVSYPPVAISLCDLLSRILEPLYRKISATKAWKSSCEDVIQSRPNQPKLVTDFGDLTKDAFPMIAALGPYIHHNIPLIYRVVRIARAWFAKFPPTARLSDDNADLSRNATDDPEEIQFCWYQLLMESILPGLSLIDCASALSEEIWELLQVFPFQVRFQLYESWEKDAHLLHPELMEKRAKVTKGAKDMMKRLSKDNVKLSGRAFGKMSHSNPTVVFEYALRQVVIYDNLILPVVESFKYLTNLSLDILGYCIVEMLADQRRSADKHDGMNIASWMQNLCNFAGAMYKKYPIDLMPILHFVTNQLAENSSFDVLLLKEIVGKLGGIEALQDRSMNVNQILAYGCGGDILRLEVLNTFSQIKNTKKSIQRLKDALVKSELAVPLFLAVSQQRVSVIFPEAASSDRPTHNKLVSQLYDQIQEILVQFATFLSVNMSAEEYSKLLPPFVQVLGLSAANDAPAAVEQPSSSSAKPDEEDANLSEGSLIPVAGDEGEMEVDDGELVTTGVLDEDVMADADGDTICPVDPEVAFCLYRPKIKYMIDMKYQESASSDKKPNDRYYEAWRSVMDDVEVDLLRTQPQSTWDHLSPALVAAFWSLSLADLKVPVDQYDAEIQRLEHQIDSQKSVFKDFRDMPTKLKREIERWTHVLDLLKDEKRKQKEHVDRVLEALRRDRERLFELPHRSSSMTQKTWNDMLVTFLQVCVVPRVSYSVIDAMFCAQFIYTLHGMRTPNFATLYFYDKLFYNMAGVLASLSEDEANRFGKFLRETFAFMSHWHKKENFPEDYTDYPGFLIKNPFGNPVYVNFEDYRHLYHKWQYKIGRCFTVCLESNEYVQIRNALLTLIEILPEYPLVVALGTLLMKRVEKVITNEAKTRRDLSLLATSYKSHFNARMKTKPLVGEEAFHIKPKPKPKPTPAKAPVAKTPIVAPSAMKPPATTELAKSSPKTPRVKEAAQTRASAPAKTEKTPGGTGAPPKTSTENAAPSSTVNESRASVAENGDDEKARARKTTRDEAKIAESSSPPPAKKDKKEKKEKKATEKPEKEHHKMKKELKHKKESKEDKQARAERKLEKKAAKAAAAEAAKVQPSPSAAEAKAAAPAASSSSSSSSRSNGEAVNAPAASSTSKPSSKDSSRDGSVNPARGDSREAARSPPVREKAPRDRGDRDRDRERDKERDRERDRAVVREERNPPRERERERERIVGARESGRSHQQQQELSPVSSSSGGVSPSVPVSPQATRRISPITSREARGEEKESKRRPLDVQAKVSDRGERDRREKKQPASKRPAEELEDGEYAPAPSTSRRKSDRVERPSRSSRGSRDVLPPPRAERKRDRSPEWFQKSPQYQLPDDDYVFGPSERERSPVRHVVPLEPREGRRRIESDRYSRRK